MAANFALAPPAKVVDGLTAAPIDIQRITASLVFDGATQSGSGDATPEFVTGPQAGSPIFDLRQTITGVWNLEWIADGQNDLREDVKFLTRYWLEKMAMRS
jgi:hypothetical protein